MPGAHIGFRSVKRRLLVPVVALALAAGGCGGDDNAGGLAGSPATQGAQIAKKSAGTAPDYNQSGGILADSGFRPEKDGFGFENYGPGFGNLTPTEMEQLFGPSVCASRQGEQCLLSPPAQAWMNEANNGMNGGHCFGFSVTALMMFDHALSPSDFGAPSTPLLQLPGNIALQGRIAQSFILQTSPKVRAAELEGTPNEILDAMVAGLKNHPDTYTLGFFRRDGTAGHAVTPYAVEDKGGGKFAVLIYDNNFPGVTRAMEFDRTKNTWSYQASPNPDVQPFLYEGDAQTRTTILIPTSPGIGVQPCPFCAAGIRATRTPVPAPTGGTRQVTVRQYDQVSLAGDAVNHAHLLLTDAQGRRTGYVGDRLVKEIPGVQVQPKLTNQNFRLKPEPTYQVPHGLKYSISVDGSQLEAPATDSVTVIGPGYNASVSDITVRPGEKHELTLRANGTKLEYKAADERTQSPDIELGFDRRGASDNSFAVATHKLGAGATLTASANPATGRILVGGKGVSGARAVINTTSIKPSGRRTTRQRSVRLP
jgi:hypothetical protein